jgi:hypothetical protein
MAERKVIHVEPESETGKLLKLVADEPISVESGGKRFKIEREKTDLFEDYDPAKALEGLRSLIGLYSGMDVDEFMREIKEQREQDSIGRPAE